MITLGIDLSSNATNTATCRIDWPDSGLPVIHEPHIGCDDDTLDEAINEADVVGIDAPFGWPEAFREAVGQGMRRDWSEDTRKSLRLRATDWRVIEEIRTDLPKLKNRPTPLSVSADKIAMPAMRAMALLQRHGISDRSGDGKFYEVYPAASLAIWHLHHRGYKSGKKVLPDSCTRRRREMRESLVRQLGAEVPEAFLQTDHALDALIAALTARAAACGLTRLAGEDDQDQARTEGWIHLPQRGSLAQLHQLMGPPDLKIP